MTNPINISSGDRSVDISVVPYIRASEVQFNSFAMKPGAQAYFYFDETNVTAFVQKPSQLVTSNTVSSLRNGDILYSPTSRAVATVVGTSFGTTSNTVYINENILSLNVSQRGADTLTSTSYVRGDLVYQASGNTVDTITFLGSVSYWNVTSGTLAVTPESGTVNVVSKTLSTLRSAFRCNADSVVSGVRFPVNSIVANESNSSASFLSSSYAHYSGVVASANANTNTIHISGPTASMVGNVFYITSGSGINQSATIVSNTSNTVTLSTSLAVAAEGNTRYSVGDQYVDSQGVICGTFNIPELSSVRFLTGERIFSITNRPTYGDSDAEMTAKAKYVASGHLNLTEDFGTPTVTTTENTTQNEIINQPTPSFRFNFRDFRIDPIAQTFFTPSPKSTKTNYGIFVSSVDLWFKSKPSSDSPQFPVELRIVKTENGFPTEKVIARKVVRATDVKISSQPIGELSSSNSTKTNFRFDSPVYLKPSSEYALVIISESPEYEVWISELGQIDITDTINQRRISEQPYSGSFFRSQNASLWTPFQNQDLMFAINKAVFDTAADAVVSFNVKPGRTPIYIDEIMLHSADIDFPSTQISYKFNSTFLDGSFDVTGDLLTPDKKLNYSKDLRTSSSLNVNRRRVIRPSNSDSAILTVTMRTSDSDVSPIFNSERLSSVVYANFVNNGGIYPNNISITSRPGTHLNAANITVTFSSPDVSGGTTATANVLPAGLVTGNVVSLNMLSYGSGYTRSPTILITEPTATTNATAIVSGEDYAFGGNASGRYVTRKITLAEGFDAGDLRVYLNCIRPTGTEVLVYYKVLSASDSDTFGDKRWVQMTPVQYLKSPDQLTPVEIEYAPAIDSSTKKATGYLTYEENGVSYPLGGKFKHFAIKVSFFAQDASVVPVVRGMRALAVPAG